MATRKIFFLFIVFHCTRAYENLDPMPRGVIDHLNAGMQFAKDFLGSESVALKVAEFVVKAFQPVSHRPSTQADTENVGNDENSQNDNGKAGEQVGHRMWLTSPMDTSDTRGVNGALLSLPPFNIWATETSHSPYETQQVRWCYFTPVFCERVVLPRSSQPRWEQNRTPSSPLRQLVRLLGLQPAQLNAVAINALLFVAQMISTLLIGRNKPKKSLKSDDLLSYILNKKSSTLQDLISQAKDDSLPDLIEQMIEKQGSKEETSCIRLLVCRIIPFIKNMQKSVFGEVEKSSRSNGAGGASAFYRHLPRSDEIERRGEICEKRYPECNLNNG